MSYETVVFPREKYLLEILVYLECSTTPQRHLEDASLQSKLNPESETLRASSFVPQQKISSSQDRSCTSFMSDSKRFIWELERDNLNHSAQYNSKTLQHETRQTREIITSLEQYIPFN